MGKIVVRNQPCVDQVNCRSSNARQVYEDESSYCFSCDKFFGEKTGEYSKAVERKAVSDDFEVKMSVKGVLNCPVKALRERKISKEVCEFFGVRVSVNPDGEVDAHYYPYENNTAFKVRGLPKRFSWLGKSSALFGRDKFNGGGKRLIITEGEEDALAVAEANYRKYGKIYPVVSLSSAIMTDSILQDREWVRSFNEVVLWMDNDEAGKTALAKAVKIVGIDKAKIVNCPRKDASDVLLEDGDKLLMQYVFDAAPHIPSGIISAAEIWKQIIESQNQVSIPYPPCARGLTTKTKGMRGGQISLFISGTGSGKTTLMKETALHLIAFQPDLQILIDEKNSKLEEGQDPIEPYTIKVGIVSLEEPPAETGKKLASMELKLNISDADIPLSVLKEGFDKVFASNNIMLLDHQGSMNDSSIIEKLEYMILCGCTHLIIDHITILVSEGADGLTGNEAQDKVMNDLLRLVTRYPHVWIGLVSHLRKTSSGKPFEEGNMPSIDDIKGSGSIKQISFDIIAFCRNMIADDEDERNTIDMSVLKCRHTGLTGSVPGSRYDHKTGRLVYIEDVVENFSQTSTTTVKPKTDEFKKVDKAVTPKNIPTTLSPNKPKVPSPSGLMIPPKPVGF